MKLLGLIGGVSPEATVIYYRLLTEAARARLGPLHSANLMFYALDYGVMIEHYDNRDWEAFNRQVVKGAKHLESAGVEALVICSNTTHVAADAVARETRLPLIHMLDVLAEEMKAKGAKRPLLLGTPVVMGEAHYRSELAKRYDGQVLVPTEEEQALIGRVILDELVLGNVYDSSRDELLAIIDRHKPDGVILGCTELCMILAQDHCDIPVFDTTGLHAAAAARFAFGEG
ncbi:aspartate/glutamate racemase family protein [Hyphococcus luteus]|uniref:Aspartate/glutamate racemase n=1 Tax=Hyphococcus luteus TaxID=2058213 RepID=A0A2S7K4M3_9PROT|nr:amino acid racemase [Marinicaulis flavus]PQA87457.1 aspartate/glutamate racemase [Marinicaulis flavus]